MHWTPRQRHLHVFSTSLCNTKRRGVIQDILFSEVRSHYIRTWAVLRNRAVRWYLTQNDIAADALGWFSLCHNRLWSYSSIRLSPSHLYAKVWSPLHLLHLAPVETPTVNPGLTKNLTKIFWSEVILKKTVVVWWPQTTNTTWVLLLINLDLAPDLVQCFKVMTAVMAHWCRIGRQKKKVKLVPISYVDGDESHLSPLRVQTD